MLHGPTHTVRTWQSRLQGDQWCTSATTEHGRELSPLERIWGSIPFEELHESDGSLCLSEAYQSLTDLPEHHRMDE